MMMDAEGVLTESDDDQEPESFDYERRDDGAVTYTGTDGSFQRVESRKTIGDPAAARLPRNKACRVGAIALFSAMGSFLFGLDIGYIGPIIESQTFLRDVIYKNATASEHLKIPPDIEGMIVSLFSIGAIITACPLISSYCLDELGRKPSIMLGSAVFMVGGVIQATSDSKEQLLVGRFVAGMSIGLLSSVIVLYQSELAPASLRGTLGTLYQFMITFGILIAAFVDQMLVETDEGWRWVMWLMNLPALLLFFGMFFLPRSPRWLMQKNRRDDALKVLYKIRAEAEAHQETEEICEEIEKAKSEGEPRWSELFTGRVGRLLVLGVVLQLLQQLCGMNAFMYFGPKIFEGIFGAGSKNMFSTITNAVNFIATFPAVFLADRAGRRSLMVWSAVGMLIACTVTGLLGTIYLKPDGKGGFEPLENETVGWVMAISIFFFVANFAFGFGPIVWVYIAEIFPIRYRARANGLCTMANWVGNFAIAQFTPELLDSIHFATFFVFGIFCAIGLAVSCWLPETRGVPLELVGQLFDDKVGFKGTSSYEGVKSSDDSESE